MARNPTAYIRIRGRGFDISCYLGNGRPKLTGGGAEYEAGKRPRSDAVTLFTGNALLTVDVPVLFDGWKARRNIGPRVDQIYNLCFGRGRNPPPNFRADFPGPGSGNRFQMSLPEELDDPRPIVVNGVLYRQALVLKLIEYNDPTSIRYRKRGVVRGTSITAPTSIVLRQPMTLLQIAARYFDDASEATRIGRLNGIADIRKKLPVGRRIKLGVGSDLTVARGDD